MSKNSSKIKPWLVNHGDFDKIFIRGDKSSNNIMHHMVLSVGVTAKTSPNSVKIYDAFLSHPYFYSSKHMSPNLLKGSIGMCAL